MTENRPKSVSARAQLGSVGRVALSVSLLAWLLYLSNTSRILQLAENMSLLLLLAIFVINLFAVFLSAVKWKLLLSSRPVGLLFQLNLVGAFYSVVLPGQIAGDVVKAYRLGKGVKDSELVVASIVLDRATGLMAILMTGVLGAMISTESPAIFFRSVLAMLFAVGLAGLFALRWSPFFDLTASFLGKASCAVPQGSKFFAQVGAFIDAWRGYLDQYRLLAVTIAISVAQQTLYVLCIVLLADPLGIRVSVYDWFWIFAAVSVAVMMPISLGGVGIREGAFVSTLALLQVSSEQALTLSLTIFAVQLAIAVLGGILEASGVRERTRASHDE